MKCGFKNIGTVVLLITSMNSVAGEWFNDVTVSKVISLAGGGIQLRADKGCSAQPNSSEFISSINDADNEHINRIMGMALTALTAVKTVNFYADCSASTASEFSINK